ncbi:MAG: hypothetical protein ACPGXZ_04375 [Saprospiraceae bacterium]
MKNLFGFAAAILLFSACQTTSNNSEKIDLSKYPEAIQQVLAQHGGLENWNKMHGLQYRVNKEIHTIDLKNRRDKITSPDYKLGFDGTDIWLDADTSFKRNAAFYHNLYFYFYAMPFVLADEGTIYSETSPITIDSITYPGVKVSFEDGVGQVSKDEYLLHYHPETHQMAWLGYTVTYYTKEKGSKFSWINYKNWDTFNGVVLPTELEWYKEAEGIWESKGKSQIFEDILLQETSFSDEKFEKSENARIVKE